MRHIHDLRVRLQHRRNRVQMTDYRNYETELQLFLQFLDENPYLRALVCTLEACTEVDFDLWKESVAEPRSTIFPASEEARAKLCLGILKQCAYDTDGQSSLSWGMLFSGETNLNEIINDLNDAVLIPLVNYLDDRIDDTGNVLYLLQRFKLKAEWFRRQELLQLYRADTGRGEANLDCVLREALFDGGVDFPFSQPASPSGRADVVSLNEPNDPLVLEVKVFHPDRGKGKSHLRQGFHQVLRYANDYQQNVGYLVVFNCSDQQLVLPSDESAISEFTPRIVYDGKTFFFVSIDLGADRVSASREKPSARAVISYRELIGEDDPA